MTEIWPPAVVNAASATGTGQIPDKEDQMYVVTRDDLYLVPTAEVPVTNLHRDEILGAASQLPIRYAAYSPVLPARGRRGRRPRRGILRVHQFDKVEMVFFERPEASADALEEIVGFAETLLQRSGLPYRVLLMATGDMGFVQAKKYDLEVWAPGVEDWLEVSSCSNFRDYQARRMAIRYRPKAGAPPALVHTLNGSGLALPRVFAAILETYQQPDGSVEVPDVLRARMGMDRIEGPARRSETGGGPRGAAVGRRGSRYGSVPSPATGHHVRGLGRRRPGVGIANLVDDAADAIGVPVDVDRVANLGRDLVAPDLRVELRFCHSAPSQSGDPILCPHSVLIPNVRGSGRLRLRSSERSRVRVVVVGGGVVGLSTAWFLLKAGAEVTVITEREFGEGASAVNAGWIAPALSGPVPAPGVLSGSLRWMLRPDSPFYARPRLDPGFLRWLLEFRAHCNAEPMAPASRRWRS